MRDPKRIQKFCNQLAEAWRMTPDLRFGQLMMNVFSVMADKGRDPFFPEEPEMLEAIRDYCLKFSGNQR